jgi:predicted RND superfamily exporter protein
LSQASSELHRQTVACFSSLSRYASRQPWLVLAVAAVVALGVAPGLWQLKLRTDGQALVPQDAPEVLYDQTIRDQFGIEDQLVVLVRSSHPAGIFNPTTIQLVRDLTADLQKLPGINPSNVMSLATEPSFRMRPGSLMHQTMLEVPLQTRAELDQLREDLRRIELYTGTVIATNGRSAAIMVGLPETGDRTQLYRQVLDIIAARQRTGSGQMLAQSPTPSSPPDEIRVTGAPVAESLLGMHILEDLGVPRSLLGVSTQARAEKAIFPSSLHQLRLWLARRIGLVPVAALVMMAVFFACFRNVLAMLVPLPGVAASTLFAFGLMGWCGVPIYLTMAVMPVLLIATGVTNDIYLFTRYFNLLRQKPGVRHQQLVEETFHSLASPVASTSLTTAVAFLSFAVSPLAPVKAFGVFTGIGVLFGLLYSLTVVPAILTLLKPEWLVPGEGRARLSSARRENQPRTTPRRAEDRRALPPLPAVDSGYPSINGPTDEPRGIACWSRRLGLWVVRWRGWVAAAAVALTAITPLGLLRLRVQDSWTDAFDPESEFRETIRLVNEQFHGLHLLFVSFDMPATVRGEVERSAITPDGIVVPGGLVRDATLIAGSPITIWNGSPPGAATNGPPSSVLRSHIEMVYGFGTNIGTRLPQRDIPADTWARLTAAGHTRFEVVVHNQVRPDIIRAIGDLGDFIRQRRQYAVGGVLSPADYLTTTRFMVRPNDPNARVLPDQAGEIKLMWDYYGLARGRQRLHQIVDTNYWESLTTVFLKDANFADTAKLMADIRAYEREHLAPQGVKLGFAGDVAVSQSLIGAIVTTQLRSLFWSLLGIYVVTALFGRSWRFGLYCVLPSALAILVKFAVMGWTGIPLGVATSMFAAMTLGIGVNCAIQLLESYGRPAANPAARQQALNRAMALTGPPALINTIAVALGFGVLMLSQVPANARLGVLVVLGLVNCFIASLVLLPILLHWWPLPSRAREGRLEATELQSK